MSAPSSHGTMGHGRECNLSLFAGEDALGKGNIEQARQLIQRAREICNIHTLQYLVAGTDLSRMENEMKARVSATNPMSTGMHIVQAGQRPA